MSIQGLNHINIAVPAPLLKQVRDFYVEVIGLEDGERPVSGVKGHWLYGGGVPLLHLMEPMGETRHPGSDTGPIDHVAFTCTDLTGMEERLSRAGVDFKKRDFGDRGFAQLVMRDPAGIKVELNFRR